MTVELRLAEKCIKGEPTDCDSAAPPVALTARVGTNVPGAHNKSRARVEMTGVDIGDIALANDKFPWTVTADKSVFRIDVEGEAAAVMLQQALQWAASEIGRQMARNKKTLLVEVP